ncbi:DEAD/DEAH box helicase [Cellulosimicrobium terreum]|nr:DEAD/DEAH box helicase [Cellulosimicrobium terreum]
MTVSSAGTVERTSPARARVVVAASDDVAALLTAFASAPEAAREQVLVAFDAYRETKVAARLDTVGVDDLRSVTRERLLLGPLHAAEVRSVGEVMRLGTAGLERISGIGPQTSAHLLDAAGQVAHAVRDSLRFRIDLTPTDPVATRLVQAVHTLAEAQDAWTGAGPDAERLLGEHARVRADARNATDLWRRLLTWGERRRRADAAVATLGAMTDDATGTGLVASARRIAGPEGLLAVPAQPYDAWEDFRARSAAYYALLDAVAPTHRDLAAAEGRLPATLVEQIRAEPLDESLLHVSLRGYQAFGARFALAQRRVVLGDEMGLGKTVEAIAVIGHVLATGGTHALVVCPASVVTNWSRELGEHADLAVHVLHGEDRADRAAAWRSGGGVAITSFAGLRAAGAASFLGAAPPAAPAVPAVLVVDEAHYVKNPRAGRSRAVAALAGHVERVLFLTGTAMENRVAEFRDLVAYLQPDLARSLDPAAGAAGPDAFRRAVAPVYLRRNAEDVLEELPELVQVDEWEPLGRVDGAAYRSAVADGAFMAMRRAAYAVEFPEDSAKLRRLVQIVEEATQNGRKVLVFSYFRDVLDLVAAALGGLAVGPLDGSVPPGHRQEIVDDFTASPVARALVSQVQVGGVGLNLQAASVVVLCEPQTKPTTEAQAVARAHRMGQVETVHVHRLLTPDSVDEHLVVMLGAKARLFDAYARRSDLAEEVASSDVTSEASLARQIVDAEQARLFVDPRVTSTQDAEVDVDDEDDVEDA